MRDARWVRRAGWNGQGMHLYLEDHLYRTMPRADAKGRVTYEDQGKYEPCVVLFTANGRHQPGWNASTPDLLAEDWEVVPWDEMR
ncbi:MAG UNVERIFIED_CONTAM: DUF2829 domain-containing protein [Methylobacterium ajmalii]|jgi:hypothetical protein|nr:DUF2829 domain-containing protein [Methylobacterium ajmalii]MBK3407538.1 DUF2829 domain-containing protein [Methylobacterium ajmalii]MBK3422114.1 DUF2829 domain-containing protein [Methylobacterium ajmalii]